MDHHHNEPAPKGILPGEPARTATEIAEGKRLTENQLLDYIEQQRYQIATLSKLFDELREVALEQQAAIRLSAGAELRMKCLELLCRGPMLPINALLPAAKRMEHFVTTGEIEEAKR